MIMAQIKIKTWLPVFPGFYGTIFEPDEDSEIEAINQEREYKGLKPVDYDEIEFDYKEHNERISKACVSFIENELSSIFKNKIKIEFEVLSSPREYNFYNDSIHIITITNKSFLKELKTYLTRNQELFAEYISESYTSYDGFMSSYSNDYKVWLNEYFKEIEKHGHYMGSILEFICKNEQINQDDMYDDACSEMYLYAVNYKELTKEK